MKSPIALPTVALFLPLALVLASCGQTGPLYMPKPPARPAAQAEVPAAPAKPVTPNPVPASSQ